MFPVICCAKELRQASTTNASTLRTIFILFSSLPEDLARQTERHLWFASHRVAMDRCNMCARERTASSRLRKSHNSGGEPRQQGSTHIQGKRSAGCTENSNS